MEDPVIFKQKKRKLALDSDNEDEGSAYVTTKSEEQKLEKPIHEKKVNGDDTAKAKNNTVKAEEEQKASKKTEDKSGAVKSKPAPQENKTNEKKDIEKKPAQKPKSVDERKKSDANGQQKKPVSKTPPKKKREASESSESEESESESEEEEKKKKKKKEAPKPKKETPKKDKKPVVEKKASPKDELIYDVLKRWWYALPEWPPANFDYAAELASKNLRKVDFKFWRSEPEVDSKGLKKVHEVPSYPGVFKDSQGEIIDLRPKDTCPSYANLKKKSVGELLELLVKAFKGQIDALEKSSPVDQKLLAALKKLLVRAEKSQEMQKAREAQKKTSNK